MKFLIMILTISLSLIAQDAKEINKKGIDAQRGFGDEYAENTLYLINSKGDTVLRQMKSLTLEREGNTDYSIFQFLNPADVRGTGLLTYQDPKSDDKQWLYLPELRRVKQIASNNKSGSFMGSEFSYEDITSNILEKYTYKYLGEEKLNGEDCYITERYPNYENSGYLSIKSWIAKKDNLIRRAEFTDRKNSLLKVQTFKDCQKMPGGFYRASEIDVENIQTHKKSILKFKNRKFKNGFKEADFSQRSLERLIN
jgi:hypothetical protein